jgi:hypothetical protein
MAEGLWTGWPVDAAGADTRNVLADEYKEHGAWARHYSSVRMTLGTFFLSAATGVIYLRWDKPELRTAVLAAVILFIGVILFLGFSWLTFRAMNRQRRIVAAYRTALGKADKAPKSLAVLWRWDVGYLCILFVVSFLAFDLWWLSGQSAGGNTVEFQIPISVQVGDAPASSFQVPVKVTVPAKTGQ